MNDANCKLRVESVSKIFGPAPEAALARVRDGASKSDIRRDSGSVVGVAEVSFDVHQGEIFVVMGLSGSGKSTLVRCLNRLIEPTAGKVLIDGDDVLEADPEHVRQIRLNKVAMVFQHFALFPHRTVGENAAYGLKIRGVNAARRREQAVESLKLVGLDGWEDAATEQLSGGMQQRVGLARALAVDPEILLMDEPFSALDPLIRRDMQSELFSLQRRLGVTVVFITHDLHEALRLGDHIAIMKEGRFVQVGTPQSIVANPADDYVREFVQDVDRGRVFTFGSIMHTGGAVSPGDRIARNIPRVHEDDRLADGYALCSAGLPIAVVDDNGRLRGVVDPLEVLDALAGPATSRAHTRNDDGYPEDRLEARTSRRTA